MLSEDCILSHNYRIKMNHGFFPQFVSSEDQDPTQVKGGEVGVLDSRPATSPDGMDADGGEDKTAANGLEIMLNERQLAEVDRRVEGLMDISLSILVQERAPEMYQR